MVYRVQAKAGQPIKVTSVVAYHRRGECRPGSPLIAAGGLLIGCEAASNQNLPLSGMWLDEGSGSGPTLLCTASQLCSRRFAGICFRWPRLRRAPSSRECPPRV